MKVWFPWDREAQKDGSDTPWIRVGQPWGGTTWGHQVIPRIGMEAVVSYQEGDPDRPFVTAIVPDPTNPVPYTLPDNKTRMTFRSKSYKSSGNNEMTFEDLTGGENQFRECHPDHDAWLSPPSEGNLSQRRWVTLPRPPGDPAHRHGSAHLHPGGRPDHCFITAIVPDPTTRPRLVCISARVTKL